MDKLIDTEVSSVPTSWESVTIESFCTVKSSSMSYKELENCKKNDDGIRVFGVKVSDMNLEGNEISFQTANLEKLIDKKAAYKRTIPPKSIVFPKRGAAIATNKKRLTTCWTVLDPNLIAVMPSEEVNYKFLFYWFHTFDLARVTDPGPTPQLNKKDIAPLKFPKPPLSEQKKINYVLSTVQLAIAQQEQLIQTTTELKKALMHKLFTEGLYGEKQKETAIGLIPESWDIALLQNCAKVQTGIAKGRQVDESEAVSLPYLRVANVQDGYLDLTEIKTITIRKREVERYSLQDGDVLLTEGGDFDKLGRGFIWNGQIENCLHQNHVFAVRVNREQLSPDFFAYQSQSFYGKRYFLSVAHRTTNLACINSTKLKAFPILLPQKNEQEEIVKILRCMDKKLSIHRRKRDILYTLFHTLLHQLMTAQTRVHDINLPGFDNLPPY
jgi:type I restriction enzyme, S subunit